MWLVNNRINIIYYSGTGGTERVAKCFELEFNKAGYNPKIYRLKKDSNFIFDKDRILLLLFPVHAFNAPDMVYKWIDSLEEVGGVSMGVISVSGGGEVSPNRACRKRVIKQLEGKGYKTIYEKMIIMPSNVFTKTNEILSQMILKALPRKVKVIVADIEAGIVRRSKPSRLDGLFSWLGKFEKYGARIFGKRIKVSNGCNGCGWCVGNCPAENIKLRLNRPEFGSICHMCLGCIYGCPNKALSPGIFKFFVIKEGYNLAELEKMQILNEQVDVEKLAKGYLWSGLRKYLKEDI